MTITPIAVFDPTTPWAGPGAGCLLCGSNVSKPGVKAAGLVGVDLDHEISFEGRAGLCYGCAVQVGRAVNMELKSVADERIRQADETYMEAMDQNERNAALAAQARLDKDVVERLAGIVFQPESVPA